MTDLEQKKIGYITLKEASERFGYAPDYIGQLIRKGKIEGKQVYASVAWMTTPEAMEEYMSKEKRTGKVKEKAAFDFDGIARFIFDTDAHRIVRSALFVVVVLLSFLLLGVFYFLSLSIDERLHERVTPHTPDLQAVVERTPSLGETVGGFTGRVKPAI